MSMMQNDPTGFRFTGWHMLGCMFAFFGTIIAVNLTMAVWASGTWTGLVVKNSYVASQDFNDQLSEAKRQAETGLLSRIEYSDGTLSFAISDRSGTASMPKSASVWIGRPAFEQQDRIVHTECKSNGLCTAAVSLAPGAWALKIEATLSTGTYRRDARLLVSAEGKVQVE